MAASLFSSSHPLDFNKYEIFIFKNVEEGHKLKLPYLYACWIMYMRYHLQIWKWDAKGGQKCL